MSISTDEWMSLMGYVVDNLGKLEEPYASSSGFPDKVHLFFWEKYCTLHKRVSSYLKMYEKSMFSQPNDILQRILLHRTQEYDGLNAKIGIPLAFKLKDIDTDATFTDARGSYCDFYFLNKYRTVDRSEIPEGQDVQEGEKIDVQFYGKPVVEVQSIQDGIANVSFRGGGESKMSKTDLASANRNMGVQKGQKAIAIREESVMRTYRCEVLSVGEKIRVKILKHQGYPDNLVRELSQTRVTLTKEAFKEVFDSFKRELSSTPLQLVENLIKYLGKPRKLSRLKKGAIETLKGRYSFVETDLEINDILFEDLPKQSDILDNDDDVPGNYFSFSDDDLKQFIDPEKPRKKAWFKKRTSMSEILKNFVQLAKTLTTLEAMEVAFLAPEFLKARLKKTVEEIVGTRERLKKLEYPYSLLLDINQLYNYSYESLRDYYEGDELDKFIRKQMIPIRDMFDCREIEIPLDLDKDDEEDLIEYAESDYDTDDEDSDDLIPETNANSESSLRESQLVQWPVGEFMYWSKVKDVLDTLATRESTLNTNRNAKRVSVVKPLFKDSKKEFKSRIACMLTSNGRDFLENHFDNFYLPTRKDLLEIYDRLRLSLDDIFLVLLVQFDLKDKESDMTELLSELCNDILQRFFSGVNMYFIRNDQVLDLTTEIFRGKSRIHLGRAYFQPLLVRIGTKSVQDFEKRLTAQISNDEPYTAVCLRYNAGLYDKGSNDYATKKERARFYFERALQVGVYLTKYFKTARQSSDLFFNIFKILFKNNALKKLKKKKVSVLERKQRASVLRDLESDTEKLKRIDAEIQKNLYLKKTARNKEKRETAVQYHRNRRDSLLIDWIKKYIKSVSSQPGNSNKKEFRVCDALTSLIALNCIASFEHSNLDDLLQTVLINFLERGTLDLGTYAQMWFFGGESVENHWIRCKDKTTVEVLTLSRFAQIDSKFCMFNANGWDNLIASHVFLLTPNSNWGEVKGYNCNQHNLYMSYDVESTKAKQTGKRLKDIRTFNTMHNPVASHRQQSSTITFSPFQMEAARQKKMTGIAWSIGEVFGQTVVHIGSEFFLTFNNIFGCLSNKNYMPFEKFKEITNSKKELQSSMYALFCELYAARSDIVLTEAAMKKKFVENVGFIKSNYASLDLDAKLPRHNYVISVLEFLQLLASIRDLVAGDEDEHLPFLQHVCNQLLEQLPSKQKKKIGQTITVQPVLIKVLGEMFYSETFDIESFKKKNIWEKKYKWERKGNPVQKEKPEQFRIQRLVELVLLADFATTLDDGLADYKYRFHERLNKLNLAFCYKFSRQKDWAKEHKYFEKLRKKNLDVDCSHFYVEIPQCQPIIDLSAAVIPLGNFFAGVQTSFPSVISRLLDVFDFQLRESEGFLNFYLPHGEGDEFERDIDYLCKYIIDFLKDVDEKIKDDIDQETGFFTNIGYYKKNLRDAEAELKFKKQIFTDEDSDEIRRAEALKREKEQEFKDQEYSQGSPIFEFQLELTKFSKFLETLKDGTPMAETENLTNDEEELRDDIEAALKFDYINSKYGTNLLKILNFDIFVNAPMVKSIAESIMKSIAKRLVHLEDEELDDRDKVTKILSPESELASESEIDEFMSTYDLTDFTLQLRNLYEALSDYFEDFDMSPVLTKLLMTRMEVEALNQRIKTTLEPLLQKAYDTVLKVLNYYISWETLILDLREEGGDYIFYGNNAYNALRRMLKDKTKLDAEEIFQIPRGEVRRNTVENQFILDEFTKRYTSIPNVTFNEKMDEGYTFDKENVNALNRTELAPAQSDLRSFLLEILINDIYKLGEEGGARDIDINQIKTLQPTWYEEMKLKVSQEIHKALREFLVDDEFDYDPDKESLKKLLRQWKKVKKPSNYRLFIDFYKKVVTLVSLEYRTAIYEIIHENKRKLEVFFGVYFKDGLFGTYDVIRYESDWFAQMKRNIKSSIRLEHKVELSNSLEKLDRVKLKSQHFTDRFKVFYNSIVDALQNNQGLDYLLAEIEPFCKHIEEETGFSLDLALRIKIQQPWLTELINRLNLIEDISSRLPSAFDLRVDNFYEFIQELSIIQLKKKSDIEAILLEYTNDINKDTNAKYNETLERWQQNNDSSDGSSSESEIDMDDFVSPQRKPIPLTPAPPDNRYNNQNMDSSSDSGMSELSDMASLSPAQSVDDLSSAGSGSVSPEEITLFDPADTSEEDNSDGILTLGQRFKNYLDELQDLYEAALDKKNEFKKSFLLWISDLLFSIHPTNNTEMIQEDVFFSALSPLKLTLKRIYTMARDKSDLEFLRGLENLLIPEMLRHLQYREDNQTKNLYNELCDLLEETIIGEFSWTQRQVDSVERGKKNARVEVTLVSHLLENKSITKTQFDNLKNYERQFGIRDTLLVRLKESEILLPAEVPPKPVFVYQVKSFLKDIIETAFIQKGMKLSEKKFERSPELKFSDIINILQIYSEVQLDNATNRDLKERVFKLVTEVYEVVKNILQLRFQEAKKEFVEENFQQYIREAIEKILLYFCTVDGTESHFFVWGKDLKCFLCGQDINYQLHIDEIALKMKSALSETVIKNIYELDEEVFSDEDL